MSKLLSPVKIGALSLSNRVVMAPLTRARANNPGRVPNDLMVKYYTQRATAGLILTEATSIDPMGVGYANTPGIWSEEQVEGWKKITKAVHDKNGKIVMQLWHVGRVSDPMFLSGETPVAPSAIKPSGHVSLVRPHKEYVTPRALRTDEIPGIIAAYKRAAQNARDANFDGVEIHGANGYLLDQFLHDGTNHRTDQYGGSIENRVRLFLEVVDAVIDVWGADRVGVHLSPRGQSHDVHDSDPLALFGHLVAQLGKRRIAFIFTREYQGADSISHELKKIFGGALIANEKFTKLSAEEILENGNADAVSFGLPYISNPDLVRRFSDNLPLNETDLSKLYGDGEEGYTDYKFID